MIRRFFTWLMDDEPEDQNAKKVAIIAVGILVISIVIAEVLEGVFF